MMEEPLRLPEPYPSDLEDRRRAKQWQFARTYLGQGPASSDCPACGQCHNRLQCPGAPAPSLQRVTHEPRVRNWEYYVEQLQLHTERIEVDNDVWELLNEMREMAPEPDHRLMELFRRYCLEDTDDPNE